MQDLALAGDAGGGVLIATAVRKDDPGTGTVRNRDEDSVTELSLTSCDDWRCARPRTVSPAARLPYHRTGSDVQGRLAVAVAPPDRPVVAWLEPASATLRVLVCDTAGCLRPKLTGHPLPADFIGDDAVAVGAVAVAVPPDGRPVIAYQGGTGDLRLLRCRTWRCDRLDAMGLGAGLRSPSVATLVLDEGFRSRRPAVPRSPRLLVDESGRIVLAAYDEGRRALVLAICGGQVCDRTPIARVEGRGGPLAMALDRAGRPTVAWEEHLDGEDWRLRLTTLDDPAG
ncbi:hypothetical protein FAF44_45250 [Nonomuraea sp. MG754425]|uniref:hypothetical protein n=1 Tax=Nonomuraea sp. MG754425 TaxID=2570319 RepID=UPI001F19F8B0|nr:hypothetical protein [Nonomuraea sp. MG754425]MCF6475516.1 hypothetical protein [Nonomuraea sp. MG754425]